MKKFFISTLLVCSMLLSLGTAAYADTSHSVSNLADLEAALNSASPVIIDLTGDIVIGYIEIPSDKEVTIRNTDPENKKSLVCHETVYVDGKLTLEGNVSIVCGWSVAVSGSFTMVGGYVTVTDEDYAVDIGSGGSFTLSRGTVSGKSGVRVNSSGDGGGMPSFAMSGGKVIGSSGNGVESVGNIDISGGEISGTNSGIVLQNSYEVSANIKNASISGNTSGVEIGPGYSVTMKAGTVVESSNGNGVVNNGTFTMEGGSIKAAKVGVSNEDNGSFTMKGGSVTGEEVGVKDNGTNQSQITGGTVDGTVYDPSAPVGPNPGGSGVNTGTVPAAPVVENVYYIPATDDNSNMALWSILALALLSTAFVTRKRKSEN